MPGIFLMHIRSQPSKTRNYLQTYEQSGEPNSTSSPQTTVTTISSAMIDNVKQHSEWFPCVESHYCRASTQRQYHNPSRLVPTMHSLYVDSLAAKDLPSVKLRKYNEILRLITTSDSTSLKPVNRFWHYVSNYFSDKTRQLGLSYLCL